MSSPTFLSLANAGQHNQTNTGAAYNTSVTLTDVSPGGNTLGQAFQFQADQLYPGMVLRVGANGIFSTTGTPTLLLGVYYGGVAGTALAATAATTTANNVSNGVWSLSSLLRVISVGTAGSIQTLGQVHGLAAGSVLMPATSATGNTVGSLDTSTAKIVTVGAQWGTNNVANTLTCYSFTVEYLTQP